MRTSDTLRDQVVELIEAGQTFTNRELQATASVPVTIHAARRITRVLTNARRLRVVGRIGRNGKTEVYGPGRFASAL